MPGFMWVKQIKGHDIVEVSKRIEMILKRKFTFYQFQHQDSKPLSMGEQSKVQSPYEFVTMTVVY